MLNTQDESTKKANTQHRNQNNFDIELKIVDFGIFGSTRGNNPEKSNAGSLKYMPPEVLIGFNESSPKIDVWALGIMLYALIMGTFPFKSSNKEELKRQIIEKDISINRKEKSISQNCKDLISKMLDKDPNKRIGVSEIFDHPWISYYRQSKRMKEWGFFGNEDCEIMS